MLELVLPNSHALAVMALIIAALALFSRERIPLQQAFLEANAGFHVSGCRPAKQLLAFH